MGTQETTAIRIGLHEVAGLRWPKQVLTGDGKRETATVPLPRLPWSAAAIKVPMGESAARAVERVGRLRKIFGYGVAPARATGRRPRGSRPEVAERRNENDY